MVIALVDPGREVVAWLVQRAEHGLAGIARARLAGREQPGADPDAARVRDHRQHAQPAARDRRDSNQLVAQPGPERDGGRGRPGLEQLLLGDVGRAVERARVGEHELGECELAAVQRCDPHGCTLALRDWHPHQWRATVREMRAMMLCAGLSSRLGTLGAERPKPMLPVCGIPIAAYGIANLVAHGITDIVINTHHLREVIEGELGDGSRWGARIEYLHEPQILGTGGGLKHALGLLDPDGRDEPFLSCNGKLIFDLDVTALMAAYRAAGDVLGMMVVKRVPDAKAWGAVDVAHDLRGAHVVDVLREGEHMFCGVHVTRPSVMARLPEGEADSLRQGYLPWMHAGERVAAYEHRDGYFSEHSTPERYIESNRALLDGVVLRHPPGRLVGIDASARIDPSVTLVAPVRVCAGATIGPGITIGPHTVVGEGATVGVSLARTIVEAGAIVTEPPSGPIVTR
ncbi:MAG: NDP-sugar synthase [Kofleriaceae bacterium]